jgi:hypothetical protein
MYLRLLIGIMGAGTFAAGLWMAAYIRRDWKKNGKPWAVEVAIGCAFVMVMTAALCAGVVADNRLW